MFLCFTCFKNNVDRLFSYFDKIQFVIFIYLSECPGFIITDDWDLSQYISHVIEYNQSYENFPRSWLLVLITSIRISNIVCYEYIKALQDSEKLHKWFDPCNVFQTHRSSTLTKGNVLYKSSRYLATDYYFTKTNRQRTYSILQQLLERQRNWFKVTL